MRGGRALSKIFVQFSQTDKLYIGSIWGWGGGGGETPAQVFWHIGVQQKWYKLSKLGGGGEGGNLDKILKNSSFFRDPFCKRKNCIILQLNAINSCPN